jgi:hypothetical protein
MIDRIGGNVDNMIIIDKNMANFGKFKGNGIEFPWKGEKKDTRLADLLGLLEHAIKKVNYFNYLV